MISSDMAERGALIFNSLKTTQKNGDGSFRGPFAPPVATPGTFSLRRRAPENRVTSKALTEWAGYRPGRLRPILPLSLALFSGGWELRQFSTQLGFSVKSSLSGRRNSAEFESATGCRKGSENVLSRSQPAHHKLGKRCGHISLVRGAVGNRRRSRSGCSGAAADRVRPCAAAA